MSNLWFEIRWHFQWNWEWYIAIICAAVFLIGLWHAMPIGEGESRPPATITTLAEGTIVGVRATGAWENWCKIELKFESGVVMLTPHYFIQKWNIREGREYRIQRNSRTGMTAEEVTL